MTTKGVILEQAERSDAIEPAYPARHSPSSLDELAPKLSAWLSAESVKSPEQINSDSKFAA
ncbi:hypothetical protein RB25_00705 [Herbaspirillum rubrisubalbicans]|nr:hypothetical protein RB25_00705 [Herbaspirillum rubrisubalbicans]